MNQQMNSHIENLMKSLPKIIANQVSITIDKLQKNQETNVLLENISATVTKGTKEKSKQDKNEPPPENMLSSKLKNRKDDTVPIDTTHHE